MAILLELIVIIVSMAFMAVFTAYEMALASVSRPRLFILDGRKVKGAADALFMKDNMEASLAVIQLGITLLGAVAAATGGLGAADKMSPWLVQHYGLSAAWAGALSVILIVIPLSFFTIIFAELVPKMVALNNRERVCLALAPAMRALFTALSPVVRLLERIVKKVIALLFGRSPLSGEEGGLHELHAAAALARTSRLIGAREEKIVVAAAQLSSRRVREIVIPASEMCTIPLAARLSEALVRAHMDMHTRFPVCGKGGDQEIRGYINFKDIIAALRLNPSDPTVQGIVRPIRSVDAEASIAMALETMIQENLHIMLVTVRDKGVLGMITQEDIIEELVGDIEDEFDRFPSYIHPFAGGWIVSGGITMGALSQVTGRSLVAEGEGGMRFADWCGRLKAGAFEGGEIIESMGLTVTVRKLRRRKVGEAAVVLK